MQGAIANLHISAKSGVAGKASISIASRQDIQHTGVFNVVVDVHFNPASDEYPVGTLRINVDLSDSIKGIMEATSIELINSFGKHCPTIIFTGRCIIQVKEQAVKPMGCKYWILIADNKNEKQPKETSDIVSFLIIDRLGERVAYGSGPVTSGDLRVLAV